jgi:putative copper resistance protein D
LNIGPWDLLAVTVKTVLYAATLGAAGGVLFLSYCDRSIDDADRRRIGRLTAILIAVSLTASLARVLVTAASMSGDASGMLDAELLGLAWHSGEGRAVMVRAAGLVLALPWVLGGRRCSPIALVGAAAAATSFAWVGHTHAIASVWPRVLIAVHLLGAAFWLGALGPLLMLASRGEPRRVAVAAARFGAAAVPVVGALVLAGLALLAILLGDSRQLWNSAYGRTACTKLALVACLLALAAFNKLRLTPRVAAGDAAATRSLRRSVAAELGAATLVLMATAALTTLTGPPTLE